MTGPNRSHGIGSYELDVLAGRWVGSAGLEAIFGIDASFDRTVEG